MLKYVKENARKQEISSVSLQRQESTKAQSALPFLNNRWRLFFLLNTEPITVAEILCQMLSSDILNSLS